MPRMAYLTKEEIQELPEGVYVTRKCDFCREAIISSVSWTLMGLEFHDEECMHGWVRDHPEDERVPEWVLKAALA